ncbi:MAG: YbfB/YjiJ family MFS transporter [Microcystaceae cyanobacterium]
MTTNQLNLWQARLLGGGSTFVGIGLARMAFTPLAAVAVNQGLWAPNVPSKIGAFLLMSYAVGAIMSPWLLKKWGASQLLKVSLFFSTICLFFETVSQQADTWLITRSIFGFFGACLMVSGPILALAIGNSSERRQTQIWTFIGIGLGACLSASLLELHLAIKLMLTPIMLCCFGLLILSLLWIKSPLKLGTRSQVLGVPLPKMLIVAYGLYSIAYIPATVYLSDYVTNELGFDVGNKLWQLFGVGAILGPWLANFLSKRTGSAMALWIAYISQNFAFFIFTFSQQIFLLAIGSFITGICVPGIVLLTASELNRILKPEYFPPAWSIATLVFACCQALSAMMMAFWFRSIKTYQPMFLVGTLLLIPTYFLVRKPISVNS